MNRELTVYFEGGCNAIFASAKYVMSNGYFRTYRDIYHDSRGNDTNINNKVEKVLKSSLSPMRVPIFNLKQVNTIYHDTSMKKDLIYWMINPSSNPIEAINIDQKFSISLVLMCDHNKLLSIVSVPSEDKIYFEYLDKGVFVIEGLIKKRFDPPVSFLLAMAKPISQEGSEKHSGQKNPNTHYWLG